MESHVEFMYDVFMYSKCFYSRIHHFSPSRFLMVVNLYKRIPPVKKLLCCFGRPHGRCFFNFWFWLLQLLGSWNFWGTEKSNCTDRNLTNSGTRTYLIQKIKLKLEFKSLTRRILIIGFIKLKRSYALNEILRNELIFCLLTVITTTQRTPSMPIVSGADHDSFFLFWAVKILLNGSGHKLVSLCFADEHRLRAC